jgi:DeoR family transcriptional regulator of aga operon
MSRDSSAERRTRLGDLVQDRGFVRVVDAAEMLGVSEVTIRGDLSALEDSGDVVRIHGGAMPRRAMNDEPTLEQSLAQDAESKRDIGTAAAALVSSGQSVILDVGSTAFAVATALVEREDLADVSVVTNGLSIALALEAALPRFTIVVTGGTLRPLQHSLVNPGASAFIESLHVDIAFIGCNGVDPDRGVTNLNYPEAEVKRRMMLSAKRKVLIADSGKLGQVHMGLIGAIDEFDLLITGSDAAPELVEGLRDRGLDVLQRPVGRQ